MFGRSKSKESAGVSGAIHGIHARISEINTRITEESQREDRSQVLIARFEKAQVLAQSADRAAAEAKEERDEFRRVLAATIATERRTEARLEAVDSERLEAHGRAVDSVRAASLVTAERDALASRVEALEGLVRKQSEQFERTLADVQDRAWTEREAARAEIVRIAAESRRGAEQVAVEVRETLKESIAEVPALVGQAAASHPVNGIVDLRRKLFVGLALGSIAVGIALVPPAVLSAKDATRQAYVHMASGLGAWELIGLVVLAFGAAASFLTLARRDALMSA